MSTTESHVWLAQCLCPQRHTILAVAGEADGQEAAEGRVLLPLRARLKFLLTDGMINPWCGLCRAGVETWGYEVRRSRFATMADAAPTLRASEDGQRLTAALFGVDGKGESDG